MLKMTMPRKTHLPVDALVFSPEAKYLYIGRDGRDVIWSMCAAGGRCAIFPT